MGLLDVLSDQNADPEQRMALQRGLLTLGATLMGTPGKFSSAMGGATMAGMHGYDQALNQARAAKLSKAQLADIENQAMLRKAQAGEVQRKGEEAQRVQGVISNAFQPARPIDANATSGVTGPRPEALQSVGQRKPIDFQALIAQGVPVEMVKALAESANYGIPEVARTIEGRDNDGRPVTTQFDKFGRPVGSAVQQWKAPEKVDTGGNVQFVDPVSLKPLSSLTKTNTPDAVLSSQTTMRGQNMTDSRAREKNAIDRDAVGKVEWKQDVDGNWLALPKDIKTNGPVTPVMTTAPGKREMQARGALGIISEAEKYIDAATGSYMGAARDMGAQAFGVSTGGAQNAAKMRAIEGALMMNQPRMEGSQSNADVLLYRQMAGQIGDSTVPADTKKAALAEIKRLHEKYAGPQQSEQSAPAAQAQKFGMLPNAGQYSGKRMRSDDGTVYRSDGQRWIKE